MEETQTERAACDAIEWMVAEGRAVESGCDPLARQLFLVWRAREYEHECLVRSRLAARFQRRPEGEQEQE